MLIKSAQLEAIRRGEIRLAFRRQKRPTVKAGGTLKTKIGVLAIDAVERVSMASITERDAGDAGASSRAELLELLRQREGSVYRIELRFLGEDPRIALRNAADLTDDERAEIEAKLEGYDKRSRQGPWTGRVLRSIQAHPAVLAATLAADLGYEKPWFKGNVRKLNPTVACPRCEIVRWRPPGRPSAIVRVCRRTSPVVACARRRPNGSLSAQDAAGGVLRPLDVPRVCNIGVEAMGLTESLEVGYRLSPRGEAFLKRR